MDRSKEKQRVKIYPGALLTYVKGSVGILLRIVKLFLQIQFSNSALKLSCSTEEICLTVHLFLHNMYVLVDFLDKDTTSNFPHVPLKFMS